jgi:sulfatase maturation enzyme AslB (radical SAM superfamily)
LEGKIDMVQVTADTYREMKRDKKGRGTLDQVLDNLVIAADQLQLQVRVNLSRDGEAEWDELFDAMLRRDLHRRLESINLANVFQPERGRLGCLGRCVANESYIEVLRRLRCCPGAELR